MHHPLLIFIIFKLICKKECIEDVQIGTLVAGYFNNSSWHRAEVKGFKSVQQYPTDPTDPLVDVFFVDFGDSDYLKLSELRKLPQRFHELPLQAIECSLDDLALNENETSWSDDAVDYFEEISYSCQWKALELKLIKYSTDVNSNHLKPSVVLTDKKKVINERVNLFGQNIFFGFLQYYLKPLNCI